MAGDYIRRDDALEITTRTCGDYAIDDGTDNQDCLPKYCPNCGAKIDAVPVVRGRWILHHTVTGNPYTECSNCCTNVAVKTDKGTFAKLDMRGMPYCPFCSAKMDGGFDDATS